MSTTVKPAKADQVVADAVELARSAAEHAAGDFAVGDYLGHVVEDARVATHLFECPHPGYRGWRWAVTMTRASRAKDATVNEVVLLPGDDSILAPEWVPWEQRLEPGDLAPGTLLPTPDNDPRLEPGFTGGEFATDADPAEWAQTRAVVSELGLGRERVLSREGRDRAAQRWISSDAGPGGESAKQAPASCVSCGYFVRLSGSLGRSFGVCSNEFSPFDARVVAHENGCGAHSSVVADDRGVEIGMPVFDTISVDNAHIFH